MVDLPLRDRSGNALVSFDSTDGAELGHPDAAPMPASLVVVVCAGRVLMVLDAWRGQWELPGGMREGGETAVQAALGNVPAARRAIERAEAAWDTATGDELDELGGICTFTRPRQLFYIADALAWIPSQAPQAQDYAARAIDAYTDTSTPEWSFADAAGSRCDLAVARITGGEPDGAREAIAPVLDLPPGQRIHAIVVGVQHVHTALRRPGLPTVVRELQEEIEDFTAIPLRALPS
jgi:hypothetical protein